MSYLISMDNFFNKQLKYCRRELYMQMENFSIKLPMEVQGTVFFFESNPVQIWYSLKLN